ncbi:MAG: hypothetical protein HC907_30120 [Richelia sp. SM1_7_0]|nr:hypothetical protein [Richelia sp. SM1_7_0]
MSVKISETLYTVNVENLIANFVPIAKEYDMRLERTQAMIDSKIEALYFSKEDTVRVEQPFLVYQEDDKFIVINGITRLLALTQMFDSDKYKNTNFETVPYLILEEWAEDDLFALQVSANDFTVRNDEWKLANAASALRNKIYDDTIVELTEKSEAIKVKKDRPTAKQIKDFAASKAFQDTLNSPLLRGKKETHLRQYLNVVSNSDESLQALLDNKVITVRCANDFIAAYNKYEKTCESANVEPKSRSFINMNLESIAEQATIDYNKANKDEEDFTPQTPTIKFSDYQDWFKANTPKKSGDSDSETEDDDNDKGEINFSEVNEKAKKAIIFSMNYAATGTNKFTKQRAEVAKSKLDLVKALIDSETDPLKLAKLDDIIVAFNDILEGMNEVTPETIKHESLVKAINKHNKAISKYENVIYGDELSAKENTNEIIEADEIKTEEIDGYVISA